MTAVGRNTEIYVPKYIGHPYLLTWGHFDIFRKYFYSNLNISNFMYLEDDILIKPNNIEYWLEGRENLRNHGLIPSFVRYEIVDNDVLMFSTDITARVEFDKVPKVMMPNDHYCYINLPQPYQGMYLLDRELAKEHLFGPSSSPEFGRWGIREKAAQGLTFANIRSNFTSRNLVGYIFSEGHIDKNSLIHHTPNNYANNPKTKFGKLLIKELFI